MAAIPRCPPRPAGPSSPLPAPRLTSISGVIQTQIDQVKALGAPSGDEATVSNFLGLAQADLNKLKSDPTILHAGKSDPFADFAKVAHPYGLTACAPNS